MSKMNNEQIRLAIRTMVQHSQGDDLERANLRFGKMLPEQLDRQYGESGKTCWEIWDEHRESRANFHEMLRHLDRMLARDRADEERSKRRIA